MYTKQLLPFLLVLLSLYGPRLSAQTPAIEITGTVVEGQSQQPVEFATVMVADSRTDSMLTGTTSAQDGRFWVKVNTDRVYLKISFIGYEPTIIKDLQVVNGQVDLGTVQLMVNSQEMDEVVVRAEKSNVEFKLDKRVFNVGKDLSNTGASALEVLNNVPSVNVNIEGEISLRGSSGVQILINGKPSVLADNDGGALGSITAEMIDRIEVITNPSAKHDAEGTSGIINIVIKKEDRNGLNGSLTLNSGVPHNHSFGLSLNRRTEHFNLFSQLGVGYRELPHNFRSINRDLVNGTSVISSGTEYRNESYYNLILGTDYHINPYNVITLSGRFDYEVEDQPSRSDYLFEAYGDRTDSTWYREETTEALNPKYRYELQYKKDFKDNKDHTLLFSALGSFFGKEQSSDFGNGLAGREAVHNEKTETNFQEAQYTFKLDYTKPFANSMTLETGGQYVMTDVSNDYEVSKLTNEVWTPDSGLTNVFNYNQKVLGLYATGAYEGEKWGIKTGLRLEHTDLTTLLQNTGESNHQDYLDFFPTLHSSYKIGPRVSLQAGYSRRIRRPRLWDLNPFFNIRNNYNIRQGNPYLTPEFTDSYELTSIYVFEKISFNAGVYYRFTTDVIERISTVEGNVTTTKPLNIGTNGATGVELNAKYNLTEWLSFNGDFNYNYFERQGQLGGVSVDFGSHQWSSKLTGKLKLPANIDLELTGQYQSKHKTTQFTYSDNLYADLGIRKKMLKGKAIVNLSIRDVFASRYHESEAINADYYLYSKGYRGRFVMFGFSYGIGKGEAMEFAGKGR